MNQQLNPGDQSSIHNSRLYATYLQINKACPDLLPHQEGVILHAATKTTSLSPLCPLGVHFKITTVAPQLRKAS